MHASGVIRLKRWMKQEQQFDKLTSEFIFRWVISLGQDEVSYSTEVGFAVAR